MAVGPDGRPHPLPMSFGVSVSGTFISDAVEGCFAGTGSGSGSGADHALPLPQGSIALLGSALVTAAVDVVVELPIAGAGGGVALGFTGGDDKLNIESRSFMSFAAEDAGAAGGAAEVAGWGDDNSPSKSNALEGAAAGVGGAGDAGAD